ncbi:MAG: hypothetical protein PHQ62_00095 [Clostridia bacterium]|nr:hypothetical protein [Clostridia bacterium]
MTRKDLPDILYNIIHQLGGKPNMMEIFKKFWKEYGSNFTTDDDIFYTWNYDIRWAATQLRKQRKMKPASTRENTYGEDVSSKGIWEII